MACQALKSCSVSSKVGILKIESCNEGLHSIHFVDQPEKINVDIDTNNMKANPLDNLPSAKAIKWLHYYFCQPSQLENIEQPLICPSIMPKKGSFTEAVWNTMAETVKFGQTVSYKELAEIAGHPGASRAVGNVMKKNSLLLLQPCHRVIKSDGTMGKFSSGSSYKKRLLLHEST